VLELIGAPAGRRARILVISDNIEVVLEVADCIVVLLVVSVVAKNA
jgi:hypothetical protein